MDLGLKGQRVLVTGGTKSIYLSNRRASFVTDVNVVVDGAITARVQY